MGGGKGVDWAGGVDVFWPGVCLLLLLFLLLLLLGGAAGVGRVRVGVRIREGVGVV